MANERAWADQDTHFWPASEFAGTPLGSLPSTNSSLAESNGFKDTFQDLAPYAVTDTTFGDLQNVLAHPHDRTDLPKQRCSHLGCEKTFKREKDLKRHSIEHDSNATIWHCGCCQNLGDKLKGKPRKDKIQSHLRNIHGKTKSVECPEEGCYTLFTTTSCVDEHLRQIHPGQHPGHTQGMPSQEINESTCDCKKRAESKGLQNGLQSGTNKHGAVSPLESPAKRGKHDAKASQSVELVPRLARFHGSPVPTTDSLASMASTEFPVAPNEGWVSGGFSEVTYSNMAPRWDVANWSGAITGRDPYYFDPINMSQSIGGSWFRNLTPVAPLDPYVETPKYRLVLENSKPADFLAIRKTLDFQRLVINLRPTYDDYPFNITSPITYNPGKETITLTGFSESMVKKVMTDLRLLVESFSKRWGGKYLVTSQPSTSRAPMLSPSTVHSKTNSETTRVFPIKPKEHRRLCQIWFQSIIPALPQILSQGLGGNYAASLVRRGRSDFLAEPCIQIESPCLPGPTAQIIIKDSVSEIWRKCQHGPISVYFTEGSVRKLNGMEGENENDVGASLDLQRLELNYGRPYSKPGMGASVGLLCSKVVSATLGGHIVINGDRYMLTSEHFVSRSRELANRDDYDLACVTLTSPSRCDLKEIEENLKQTKRDRDSEIKSLAQRIYDDEEIPEEAFNNLPPELGDAMRRNDEVKSLLEQVTKPPLEYAIGDLIKVSLERQTQSISRSLANELGLRDEELLVKHEMDWALFKTNSRTVQTGENRHKYRSNQDAMNDHYVDEGDHANQPGDVCYERCGAEPGYTVHYVGQGSKHRSGKVNIPALVSRDSAETINWAILDSDGHTIPYTDVEGDSGAWVIREDGNKLMGQVHSYGSNGQVFFTPIDVIFAELEALFESDVSLPACPPNPGQMPCATLVSPLCSISYTPPVQSYEFFKPAPVASATPPETSLDGTALPETRPLEIASNITSPSDNEHTDGEGSLPSLANSPQSSVTTPDYPKSPRSSRGIDMIDGQVGTEEVPSKSLTIILGESTTSEIPDLSLDEQGEYQPLESGPSAFRFKSQSPFRTTFSTHRSTWPDGLDSRVSKARRWSEFARLRTSRDIAVSFSTRSVLDRFARVSRSIDDVTDIETTSDPPEHEASPHPVIEGFSKPGYSQTLEGCNVVA